jgi:hypothetical protein
MILCSYSGIGIHHVRRSPIRLHTMLEREPQRVWLGHIRTFWRSRTVASGISILILPDGTSRAHPSDERSWSSSLARAGTFTSAIHTFALYICVSWIRPRSEIPDISSPMLGGHLGHTFTKTGCCTYLHESRVHTPRQGLPVMSITVPLRRSTSANRSVLARSRPIMLVLSEA